MLLSGRIATYPCGAYDDGIANRAGSDDAFRTAWAPGSPGGKQTTSPVRSVRSPAGVRTVTSPATTISHSSRCSS